MMNLFFVRPTLGNIGNSVIGQAAAELFYEVFGNETNVVNIPALKGAHFGGLVPAQVYDMNRFADAVVVGGGNLLENGQLSVDANAVEALRPPLILMALSHGRIATRDERLVNRTDALPPATIRRLVEKAALALVRDSSSQAILRDLGLEVGVGGCPTLFLPPNPDDSSPGQDILISIRHPLRMCVPPTLQWRIGEDLRRLIAALRKNSRRAEWLRIAYVEVQSLILAIAGVIILIVGGAAIVRGMMTVGELISFYFIVGLLGANMRAWWSSIPSLLAGCDSLASIHALMRSKDLEPYTGRGRIDFKGEIRFEGVRFDYGGAPVLKEVDWIITPGTSTVLLGPNGSGKTSLVHLILGFYRPRAGTLKADGIPYGELDVRALRRQIGVMPQHSDLFSGTVRANLTYGLDEIIPERIDEACRLVGADTFIQALERGYESQVGENGMLLSGGQRQRLLLARAILRRPRLLILDEPTNHLDENSIRPIAQKLRQLDFRPAILWITHHPFLQEGAERILTLDQGRLVEATPSPTRFG